MNYINVLEILEKPWNKSYNEINDLTAKLTLPTYSRSYLLINLILNDCI